ncbi:MAG: hypothetical protein PUC33_08045 [Oscillospiraceae bacterium]|nr:hypothetical protein [Oscillospiraceae bacterium]
MSVKATDRKGRWRNKTVTFRISEEENKILDSFVRMSGLTKQDYLVDRVFQRSITVKGTPKVYMNLKREAESILEQLVNMKNSREDFEDIFETIDYFITILDGFKNLNN